MTRILHLDLETFCETPITHGAHRYAEDAEVLLVAYAWDDDAVCVADTSGEGEWESFKSELRRMIDAANQILIHNSAFDRTVLRHRGVSIPIDKIVDTMILALQHSLPGSLGQLCDVLGVSQDKAKDKAGKKLIQRFTKPLPKNQKLRRATRDTHPREWAEFIEYARLDVDAMRSVHRLLPHWNDTSGERGLWLLDQRINDRGFAVDRELASAALRAFERTSRSLATRASVLTGGAVGSATQRAKVLAHLTDSCGVAVTDLTKGTVEKLLKRDDLEPEAREMLEVRQQAAATSPAKYKTLLNAASSDGRLRGTMQLCGASRTGRDAGRLFQPQNLPRPTLKPARIETGIAAMKADCEDLLFENVSELCASAVRGCLVAPEGKKLVVSDLSNIEGRVLAWLAGEDWKLKAFRDYDSGTGPDLYVASYAKSFGVSVETVLDNKKRGDGSMRQRGKVLELSMGYQGSVGAFLRMSGDAADLSEDEVLVLVRAWRKAHPATVRLWYDVEGAAKAAIRAPSEQFVVRGLRFDTRDSWLRMRLPSGRFLCYPAVCINGESGQIYYDGVNQYTRRWEALETYGGKLVENATQAIARDVFMHGLKLAEEAGYSVVLRVHDELVCEVPDTDDFTAEGLSALMATNPPWAAGLPLAAAGHEMHRYAKID